MAVELTADLYIKSVTWIRHLAIAQLVERRTVERQKTSLGHWFESGSREGFFFVLHSDTFNMAHR